MKKTKALFILFLILIFSIIPFRNVTAHSIDLDPKRLISFPYLLVKGQGEISILGSQTGYTLYYQSVEIPNSDYDKIKKIDNDYETTLKSLNEELKNLKTECENLKETSNKAFDAWNEKNKNNANDEELKQLETAYETAKTNYQNKITEYNTKVNEYNAKYDEMNKKIHELTPTYIENNWIKTESGEFTVDLSSFTGTKSFTIWAKLVTSDGTIYYDEAIYTMTGTKVEEIDVKSISLDKTSLNITEGSNYSLKATITPSNATNKSIIWSSDDENVAKVEDGKVIAISEGTSTITATTKDGEHTATCIVTVTKKDTTTTTPKQDDTEQDSTIVNGKLPFAGNLSYIIGSVILVSGVLVIITYKKIRYLNFK